MRKLIIAAIIFAASSSFAYDLGGLREQVRYKVQDTTATTMNVRWSDSFLNGRINQAQRDIAGFTQCCYGAFYIAPSTGQQEYPKPANLLKIDVVRYQQNGSSFSYVKLDQVDYAAMENVVGKSWIGISSGVPRQYYEVGARIGVYPKPAMLYTWSEALQICGWALPATMSADTDEPFNGDDSLSIYHDVIILAVTIACREDQGYDVTAKKSEYWQLLSIMKEWVRTRSDRTAIIKFNY